MCPASFLSPYRMYCKGSSNEDYEKVALDNRLAYRHLSKYSDTAWRILNVPLVTVTLLYFRQQQDYNIAK